jgi:rhamnose utilization protein RhaD (predicted bifunctional aldolase and dehydrogenase)
MKSRWSDTGAQECIERYRTAGEDVALRVYTSRLIGEEPDLVLHGGGNTSVKSRARNLTCSARRSRCST